MLEIVADSLLSRCSLLLSESGAQEFQSFGPDPSLPRAGDAREAFANGGL